MTEHIINNYIKENNTDNIINTDFSNNHDIKKENDNEINLKKEIIDENENNNEKNNNENEINYNEENDNNSNDENNQSEHDITNEKEDKYDNIYFIDTYFDRKNKVTYIIACCSQYVKSYNYNLNVLYNKYQDHEFENRIHSSAVIKEKEIMVQLIESCIDGNIRIWNFHENILLNRINVCEQGIKGICLWNNNYLFVGCDDKSIKIVQLSDGSIIKILFGHQSKVCTIKTINNEKYGKCLVSKGWGSDVIKLWINNEIN